MAEKCMCQPTEVLIFACSGGSNVGQISNQAAIALTKEGKGRFFCLAGIGGHISGITESTKTGKRIVAIDGCPVQCARKTLEHAGFGLDVYVVVTEMGIEKSHDFAIEQNAIIDVVEKVKEEIGLGQPAATTCLNRGEKVYDYTE